MSYVSVTLSQSSWLSIMAMELNSVKTFPFQHCLDSLSLFLQITQLIQNWSGYQAHRKSMGSVQKTLVFISQDLFYPTISSNLLYLILHFKNGTEGALSVLNIFLLITALHHLNNFLKSSTYQTPFFSGICKPDTFSTLRYQVSLRHLIRTPLMCFLAYTRHAKV